MLSVLVIYNLSYKCLWTQYETGFYNHNKTNSEQAPGSDWNGTMVYLNMPKHFSPAYFVLSCLHLNFVRSASTSVMSESGKHLTLGNVI